MNTKDAWAKPNKLLLAWYLLKLPKKKIKYGKNFISINFMDLVLHKMITLFDLEILLGEFLKEGSVLEIYEEKTKTRDNEDTKKELKHITTKNVEDMLDIDIVAKSHNVLYLHYDLRVDDNKLIDFINDYLENWQNNNLFLPEENFLKSENQLKIVIKHILTLLEKYPPKNLFVEKLDEWSDKIDFTAVMLFLEKIGGLRVLELSNLKQKTAFRVKARKEFFQDLKENFLDSGNFFGKLKNRKMVNDKAEGSIEGKLFFDAEKSALILDNNECEIPKHKNKRNLTYLYLLCRMVFCDRKLEIGEAISNDEVRDEAFGDRGNRIKERTVKDAVMAINRLTKDKFGWNVFEYHEASVKRTR